MADSRDLNHDQLVERLADGFAALLKQVEELKHQQEKLLGFEHKLSKARGSNELPEPELSIQRGTEALKWLRIPTWNTLSSKQFVDEPAEPSIPEGLTAIECKGSQKMACPFALMAKEEPTERQPLTLTSPRIQRPNSLPTPPETREQYIDDDDAEIIQEEEALPPASITGSISKCPIRMLDERPPEEIAEYFETHKHEIPRSHEICVRRYQSNEQSLRLLDAKYGSLANTIQGLGMKHQPLLQDKDGVDGGTKPDDAVMKWADDHLHGPEAAETASQGEADPKERESHFDRPLKEIRVGESPSRPWGIFVPAGSPKSGDKPPREQTSGPISEAKATTSSKADPRASSKATSDFVGDETHVIFNGPVFVGYAPKDAAAFFKQCGMGK